MNSTSLQLRVSSILHSLVLLRNLYQTLPYSEHMGGGNRLKYRLDTLLLQLPLNRFIILIRNGLFQLSIGAYKIDLYVRPNFLRRSSRTYELAMNHDEVIPIFSLFRGPT